MGVPMYYRGVIWLNSDPDGFRDLLEKARTANPHHLLVCGRCGWSWLTLADAKPDDYDYGTYVICSDEFECQRRVQMRMKPRGKND